MSNDFSLNAEQASASILSIAGLSMSNDERALFKATNPLGFILFARNIDNRDQLKALITDLKEAVGRDCPILIDQEGGRVQRLRPPHWSDYPPMQHFGDLYESDPEGAKAELKDVISSLAAELVDVGINVDCAPVLDILTDQTHEVIGDRAFSENPAIVAELGALTSEVFLAAGITPIIKHIPGHGRGAADSHFELPRVETDLNTLKNKDFDPFRILSQKPYSSQLWAMSAHILYTALDAELPASLSSHIIHDVIRQDIGFDGILICDDLDMKALDHYGDGPTKALKALEAGCDLALYCAGEFDNMAKIAESVPKLRADSLKRLQNKQNSSILAA